MNQMDILQLRQRLGIKQKELAQRLKVAISTVNRWEKGKNEPSGTALQLLKQLEEESLGNVFRVVIPLAGGTKQIALELPSEMATDTEVLAKYLGSFEEGMMGIVSFDPKEIRRGMDGVYADLAARGIELPRKKVSAAELRRRRAAHEKERQQRLATLKPKKGQVVVKDIVAVTMRPSAPKKK